MLRRCLGPDTRKKRWRESVPRELDIVPPVWVGFLLPRDARWRIPRRRILGRTLRRAAAVLPPPPEDRMFVVVYPKTLRYPAYAFDAVEPGTSARLYLQLGSLLSEA